MERFYIGDTIQDLEIVSGPSAKVDQNLIPSLNNKLNQIFSSAKIIYNALVAARVPGNGAEFGTYASMHETGGFQSPLLLKHNNASGIMFAGQPGAVKGDNGYAWFKTVADWANAYKHELTKGSNPAAARTIEDFVNRLKANGYFTDSVSNYLNGVQRAMIAIKPTIIKSGNSDSAKAWDASLQNWKQDSGFAQPPKDKPNWWDGLKTIEKGGIIAGAALILIIAIKK